MAASKRDQLVETALGLFYRHGFHATGVDRIVAESGVAKMTLYKHFKSKDELILAALRLRDERFRNKFMQGIERKARDPADRLLAVFDVLEEWFEGGEFSGCAFVKASAEFGRHDDPIHGVAAEHKRLVLSYIRDLARAAGAADPDELADRLGLLMEGAIVLAQVTGKLDYARKARAAAEVMLREALNRDPA